MVWQRTLVVLLLVGVSNCSVPSVRGKIDQLLDADPSLGDVLHGMLYSSLLPDEFHEAVYPFEDEDLALFRKMVRLAPPGGREEFDLLLDGASLPDFHKILDLSVEDIAERLLQDESLTQKFANSLDTRYFDRVNVTDPGYQECMIDVGAYLDPFLPAIKIALCKLLFCDERPLLCDECDNIEDGGPIQPWAIELLGAMAKIPEGIREGRLHWQGAYEYCEEMDVEYNHTYSNELRNFKGKYTRLKFGIPVENSTMVLPFYFGMCVPSTCNTDHVYTFMLESDLISVIIEALSLDVNDVYQGRVLDAASDAQFIAAVFVFVLLIVLVVIGTIWDGCPCLRKRWISTRIKSIPRCVNFPAFEEITANGSKETSFDANNPPPYDNAMLRRFSSIDDNMIGLDRKSSSASLHRAPSYLSQVSAMSTAELIESVENTEEHLSVGWLERLEIFLTGFSAYSNIRRIFHCDDFTDNIPCLNGIRTMSFAWIILGNTWLFGPLYNECWLTSNLFSALAKIPQKWDFQLVMNYSLNTDSFLVISGLLVTYWWLIRFEKNSNRLSVGAIIYHIAHKYWRMMPAIMLGLAFYSSLYLYLGDGPFFPRFIGDAENCRTNWWTNLLMLNNMVSTEKTCLSWLWFPAMLFQLHVAAIVILVPLVLMPIVAYVILAAMFIAHLGATAGVTSRIHDENDDSLSGYWDFMVAPWCRAGSYFIGMLLGITLFKVRGRTVKMHWLVVLAAWALSITLVLLVIFIPHEEYKDGGTSWSPSQNVAYDTIARNVYSLGLAWIIFACHVGHGGVFNSLLSYKFWWPLSKLVFTALCTHSMIIFVLDYGRMTPLYITVYHQNYRVIGHFWMNLLLGLAWAILWQYPLSVGGERAFYCKNKIQWIRAGRHPKEELEIIEEDFHIRKVGVKMAGSTPEPPVSASAAAGIDISIGGYVPYVKDNNPYENFSSMDEKPSSDQKHPSGDYINRQTSTTSI